MSGVATKYPSYQEINTGWIGSIPSHWKVLPLFTVLRERREPNRGNEVKNVLSLSYGRIVRRKVDNNFGLLPESFDTYQIIEQGDYVLRLTDLQNDKRSLRVGQAHERGIITSAYVTLTPLRGLSSRYGYYLLHSYDLCKVFYGMGGGLRQSLKLSDLKRLPIIIPPLPEQQTIAAFLDHETARIERLIEKQQRLIELLQEKRQAVISHAVTNGLNPDVPMKESGVEWLGEVPAHWEVIHLKRMFQSSDYGISARADVDGDVAVLRMGDLKDGEIQWSNLGYVGVSEVTQELFLKPGDILFNRTNSLDQVGKSAIVRKLPDKPTSFVSYLVRFRIVGTAEAEYVNYMLKVIHSAGLTRAMALPSISQANLNPDRFGYARVCLPPIHEQSKIVKHIDIQIQKLNAVENQSETLIGRLKEHRTALISAAVTGKIDVRDWEPPSDESDEELLETAEDRASDG